MHDSSVLGLWYESRSVALACTVLGQFGAVIQVVPGSRSLGSNGASAKAAGVPATAPPSDDELRRIRDLRSRLVEADVVVMDRVWKEWLDVSQVERPAGQIHVSVRPWADGSWRAADIDLGVQAASGLVTTNGSAGDPPFRAGVPLADVGTALAAAVGAVAALVGRARGSSDLDVEVVGEHVGMTFLSTLLPRYFLERREPPRIGNRHAMTAPWNTYPTSDGWITISTMGEQIWSRLTGILGDAVLSDDPRFSTTDGRVQNVEELDEHIGRWTLRQVSGHAIEVLTRGGVPSSPILGVADAFASTTVRNRAFGQRPSDEAEPQLRHVSAVARPITVPRRRLGGGSQVLSGLRVLELGALTAAPLATKILGYLGADVLKVEPPHGESSRRLAQAVEGTSYLYYLNNTDKRSCVLDLTQPDDHSQMLALARSADVYVTNLSLPTLENLGVAPTDLLHANPNLVACSISGFGMTSERSHERVFDSTTQAMTGIMSLTGLPEGPPAKIAVSAADLLAGWMAAFAVLAEFESQSGGCTVDVALQDAAVWAVFNTWLDWEASGSDASGVTRIGNRHPSMFPHDCYRTRDGYVAVIARDARERARLVEVIHGVGSDGAPSSEPMQSVDEVDHVIGRWVAERTTSAVVDELTGAGVSAVPVRTVSEVAQAAVDGGLLFDQFLPSGASIYGMKVPVSLTGSASHCPTVAPALGSSRAEWLT